MGWNKPVSEVEIEYIKSKYPQLSAAEIAEKLGRSKRTVEKHIARLGLRERRARASFAAETPPADLPPLRREEEIAWLAGVLKENITSCESDRNMAKLSEEYRAVLREMEGLGEDDDGDDIDGIIASVSLSRA